MGVSVTRIEPIRRDITLMVNRALSKENQQKMFVAAARRILAEADAKNLAALGLAVGHETFVDGARSESIDQARANIVRAYELLPLALTAIGALLWRYSPFRRGTFRASHILYADGAEIGRVSGNGWQAPDIDERVRELVFVSSVIYARPLERGRSKQAPGGVSQVVAALARQQFSRFAKISFTYRAVDIAARSKTGRPTAHNLRQPAIVIQPR